MSRIDFSALSERGMRERNDDAYIAEQVGGHFLLAIADGLSHHPYGDLASTTAIEALRNAVKTNPGTARDALTAGIKRADAEVKALSLRSPTHAGLATTLIACLIDKDRVCTVIDISEKNCNVITRTAILGAREMEKTHPRPGSHAAPFAPPRPPSLADMIGHVLGEPYRLKDANFSEFVLGSDFLLLSSDGLTDVLSSDAIAGIVRKNELSPDAAVEALVQEAMKAGSEGTITVILAR